MSPHPTIPGLARAHYVLMVVLTTALVIDVMKPPAWASCCRTARGIRPGQARRRVAAVRGAVRHRAGLHRLGRAGDVFGRRSSILLSSVLFVGTSICGAMPSFAWNVGMCFLMGRCRRRMLPVTYALLAETMPARHRGWVLVLVGGLGFVGGYIVASLAAAWLEPIFSWRALWFLNLPTGMALIALSMLIPESPRFLLRLGRREEARATLARFGAVLREAAAEPAAPLLPVHVPRALWPMTIALSVCGLASGLVNFGVLLWLPAHMVSLGHSLAWSSGLLAASASMALPTVLAASWLYGRWSSKRAILAALLLAAIGLAGVIHVAQERADWLAGQRHAADRRQQRDPRHAAALCGGELPGGHPRRAVGWIAACTKLGGPLSQGLTLLGMVPALGSAAMVTGVTTLAAIALIVAFCIETRQHELL
jgi:putative MFS transporter